MSDDDESISLEADRCPLCGGQVKGYYTCHTYFDAHWNAWCSCSTPCGSAVSWYCDAGCGWEYIEGLNSKNPRSAANEGRRPVWVPSGYAD